MSFLQYPVLNVEDNSRTPTANEFREQANLRENLIDDNNPVTNPFYYAQDRESWYAEVAARVCEESQKNKTKEETLKKKKKTKSLENTSYVIKKDTGAGRIRQIVKIMIHNLDVDSASVNVQYLVRSDYDEIMEETDHLVSKIVKKLKCT